MEAVLEEPKVTELPYLGDARAAAREGFAAGIKPVPMMTVSEWAEAFRFVAGEGSPRPGKWRNSRTPYLVDIMDALSPYSGVNKVVFMKGTQVGGTEVANNVHFFYIDIDPSPMAFYFSKDDKASDHSKGKLTPSIRATPTLREKIRVSHDKETSSTVLSKYFTGGFLLLMGANSPDNFAQLSLRVISKDEIDRWPYDVGGEGDPVALADKRTDAFDGDEKIYEISTPTITGLSRIEKAFNNSNQQYYYVPCPFCGRKQVILWKNIKFKKDPDADNYRKGDVYLECENEKCAELIPQSYKPALLTGGEWRAHNPKNPTLGFHLSSLYSPWLTWEKIVDEFLTAHRERDRNKMRVWVNTRLAETFSDDSEALDENVILNRLEEFPIEVPEDVAVLTLSIDIQGDRFEYAVIGWGVGHEAWVIDQGAIPGDPATPAFWEQVDNATRMKYQHALGLTMAISITGIDSGYGKEFVYNYVRGKQKSRNIFAIKGAPVADYPLIKRPKKAVEGIRLYMVGTNTAKDWLHNCLKLYNIKDDHGEPAYRGGPNYIHFNRNINPEFIEQLTSEVVRIKAGKRIWEKKNPGIANEGIDLMGYGRALIAMLNPAFDVTLKKLGIKATAIREGKPVPKAGKKKRKIYSRVTR